MLKVRSAVESEYYVQLPEILCSEWNIDAESELYASVISGALIIAKARHKNTVAEIPLTVNMGIVIPERLVETLNLQVGYGVSLTLIDDVLSLSSNNVVDLNSVPQLEKKLEREYESIKKRPFDKMYAMLLDDVYNSLINNSLDSEVVTGLLKKPNPLVEIISMLREDDEFNDFLDKKILEIATMYATNESGMRTIKQTQSNIE